MFFCSVFFVSLTGNFLKFPVKEKPSGSMQVTIKVPPPEGGINSGIFFRIQEEHRRINGGKWGNTDKRKAVHGKRADAEGRNGDPAAGEGPKKATEGKDAGILRRKYPERVAERTAQVLSCGEMSGRYWKENRPSGQWKGAKIKGRREQKERRRTF